MNAEIIALLPHMLAGLNLLGVLLLVPAYLAVRAGNVTRHRHLMITALGVAALFLAIYLAYHAAVGNVAFAGEGGVRSVYFTLLIAHIAMAVVITYMVPVTVFRALKGRLPEHRAIARRTLPIWLFVHVSGLVVYAMAFHVYAPA